MVFLSLMGLGEYALDVVKNGSYSTHDAMYGQDNRSRNRVFFSPGVPNSFLESFAAWSLERYAGGVTEPGTI
jgi:hypothetical protein